MKKIIVDKNSYELIKDSNATKVNDIKTLDDYIENYCAYGAKWFLLKKIK